MMININILHNYDYVQAFDMTDDNNRYYLSIKSKNNEYIAIETSCEELRVKDLRDIFEEKDEYFYVNFEHEEICLEKKIGKIDKELLPEKGFGI
jgi:hypothetical protein